jgi:enoyl-CoA hydratase/carnithine racemase
VVAARGPHFSVGLDLTSLPLDVRSGGTSQSTRSWQAYRSIKRLQRSISSVAACGKPVIAAVHGYCIGGGVDLISACDIRLASEDAVFSVRETKMAIVADLGTLQRLPGIVGTGHAAELAYTGKDIDARRARQIGLVNDVLQSHEQLLEAALLMAVDIASNPPNAVQGSKAVLRASTGRSVEEGLDYVAAWNAGFLPSHDLTEAVAAFVERRPPRFTGE